MKKKKESLSYGVIGLGRFGMALAVTLANSGKEVIVVDKDEEKVKEMRQYTEYAFVCTNLTLESLREVGIQNCDVVVVCIGEKVDVSLLTTMSVLELKVPGAGRRPAADRRRCGGSGKRYGAASGKTSGIQQFSGLHFFGQQRGNPSDPGAGRAVGKKYRGTAVPSQIRTEYHCAGKWR